MSVKPAYTRNAVTSVVTVYPEQGIVRKDYKKQFLHTKKLEIAALRAINAVDNECGHFPKLLELHDSSITLSYCGGRVSADTLPDSWESQVNHILLLLSEADIVHRDIRPENLHVLNGKLRLIDFGWATKTCDIKKRFPGDDGLGMHFKTPDKKKGYDDIYSLKKSIAHIRGES